MLVEAFLRADGFSEEEVKEAVAFAKLESEFGRTGEVDPKVQTIFRPQ